MRLDKFLKLARLVKRRTVLREESANRQAKFEKET